MLPFSLKCSLPQELGNTILQIVVRFGNGPDVSHVSAAEVIDLFAEGVRNGLFVSIPGGIRKWEGASEFDKLKKSVTHKAIVSGVSAKDFYVLVSLLNQTSQTGDSIESVEIVAEGNAEAADLLQAISSYSSQVSNLERLANDSIGDPREKKIEIVAWYEPPLSSEQATKVATALQIWDNLVFMGGFEPDFSLQPGFVIPEGETFQVEGGGLYHGTGFFNGPRLALGLLPLVLRQAGLDEIKPVRVQVVLGPLFKNLVPDDSDEIAG